MTVSDVKWIVRPVGERAEVRMQCNPRTQRVRLDLRGLPVVGCALTVRSGAVELGVDEVALLAQRLIEACDVCAVAQA